MLVGTMSQILGDKATKATVGDKEAREGEGNLVQVLRPRGQEDIDLGQELRLEDSHEEDEETY